MSFGSKNPANLYLFHHVGKCAGTSLVRAFGETGRYGICLGFQCHSKHEVRRSARRQLLQRRVSPRRIRVFFGHRVYFGLHHLCPHPARYFTFLRNPIDRVISLYNYHCDIATDDKHPLHSRDRELMMPHDRLISFDRWFEEQYTGNHLIRFLSYAMQGDLVHVPEPMNRQHQQAALDFLSRCWFIGFTESSDVDIPLVCQAVGVNTPLRRANTSRQHVVEADRPRIEALIESRDHLDLELFEQARSLRGGSETNRALAAEVR